MDIEKMGKKVKVLAIAYILAVVVCGGALAGLLVKAVISIGEHGLKSFVEQIWYGVDGQSVGKK